MAESRLKVLGLLSHRFAIDEAAAAYQVVGGSEPSLGILLTYPQRDEAQARARTLDLQAQPAAVAGEARINVIGAGNYAGAVLLPAFKAAGARLGALASSGGVTSRHLGRKFGFEQASTDADALIRDPQSQAVVIATRHDSHARYVLNALAAGKHVFVEKPLALTLAELDSIAAACAQHPAQRLMVGFNRRFAPLVQRMESLLRAKPGPKALVMTVNAGAIPANHWTQDPAVGGGRLIGEGCHFIDLMRHLVGAPIRGFQVLAMGGPLKDTLSLQLSFEDGSLGTLHYFANGSKAFPKERLEVFAGGSVLQLDNFRRLNGYGWPGFSGERLWRQDKGQKACAAAFIAALREGKPSPIPLEELLEVGRVCIEIETALR